jgi:YYY domain-containing protein
MIWPALLWYALLTAAGIAVWGVLRRLGLGAGAAWAVARVVGLVGQAYVGWLGGCLGWHSWWWAGAVVLGLLAWSGRRSWRNLQLRPLVEVELVGVAAFLLLAFLRLPVLAISGTEKPMDLAIWTTLLRPGTFPPSDPWLAGETLPYYYWGFLGWVLPAKLSGLTPDVTYNLLVPTLAACTAQAGWAVARALGGSKRSGVLAAFLVVFAGTLDGWRQLLGGTGLASLDLWSSSRQIAGTITEFPLFTFQLGDLHPHLLSAPLIVVTLLFARGLGNASTGMLAVLPATILYGAAAAANPWCALPLGLAVLLVAACGINGFGWPVGDGRATWIRVITVGVAGAALYLPFWLRFRPPGRGLGLVTTATRTDELLLLLGGVLVPAGLVAWELAWRWGGVGAARRRASRALWLTGAVLVVALSRRVAVGVAVALSSVFAVTAGSGKQRLVRPALGLTLGALALLVGMELVFLRDPYGVEFYRMNTVFKSVHVVFLFLGVATPALLGWLRRRRPLLAVAGATVVVLTSLPGWRRARRARHRGCARYRLERC